METSNGYQVETQHHLGIIYYAVENVSEGTVVARCMCSLLYKQWSNPITWNLRNMYIL